MYGFLSEGIGQPRFNFRVGPPVNPYGTRQDIFFPPNEVNRVRIFSQGRVLFDAVVPRDRENRARDCARELAALQSSGALPSVVVNRVEFGVPPRVDWSGYLSQAQIDQVIRILRGQQSGCEAAFTPRQPTVPFVRTRFAQVRSRGGAMTIMGLAGVGYALGGLPGAALGAAAALLKGRFDETRVG